MDNYNPRQPTSFRFKDSREIEKFKFIASDFAFATETLENVSQDKTWKKLINILVEYTHTNGPLIIYDFLNENVFVGYLEGGSYSGYSNNGNTQLVIDLSYDPTTDKLQIEYTEEEMLSADNVKTLFGNQSIIGTGNIDLYRHQISLSAGQWNSGLVIISSNKLKIDSLQDLTAVLKPAKGYGINISTYDFTTETSNGINALVYDGANWKIGIGIFNAVTGVWTLKSEEATLVTAIADIVTTI